MQTTIMRPLSDTFRRSPCLVLGSSRCPIKELPLFLLFLMVFVSQDPRDAVVSPGRLSVTGLRGSDAPGAARTRASAAAEEHTGARLLVHGRTGEEGAGSVRFYHPLLQDLLDAEKWTEQPDPAVKWTCTKFPAFTSPTDFRFGLSQ
ncbi:hypothetical protein GOODEAATRI_021176 [Goodea atripinnis]|uniref:Uncharacterized protein n=1 Tax=Goodea atripinnis TaxID=208336 RepID=A0ABV0MJI6_9TELE